MPLRADPWVANNSPIDAAKLHALGVVSYHWNRCERALFWVFASVADLPPEQCWALAYDLGDLAIHDRIDALMRLKKLHTKNIEEVSHVLKVYDICRQNRNQLTHFHPVRTGVNAIELMRTSKKARSMDPDRFSESLGDIRRVAEDLQSLEGQLWLIDALFDGCQSHEPMPWPPKSPLPALLYVPPQTVPPKPPRQPRPSAASRRKAALAQKKSGS